VGFESAIEISRAITEIDEGRWVIPAFQRRLVWAPDKMELLFDSLMRDYPIGSMLLWTLRPGVADHYPFFRFVQHYHAHLRAKGDPAALKGKDNIRAVLDGQQRLTALYMGLCGSHTAQPKYARVKFAENWPKRVLHLRLRDDPPAIQDDLAVDDEADVAAFEFRLLSEEQVLRAKAGTWFPVPDVMAMKPHGAVREWFSRKGFEPDTVAFDRVAGLRRVVWDRPPISFYLEEDQEQHKAVTIFQRINRQGSPLTMAQIVFSTVVEEWPEAHEKIDSLVATMNAHGRPDRFTFDRDFVFKAALVLADAKSIRLDVESFGRSTVSLLRNSWSSIRGALESAAELLGQEFGYGGSRLSSRFALIPIAYHLRDAEGRKGKSPAERVADRELMRRWLAEALARRAFSLRRDSKLAAARTALRETGGAAFPIERLAQRLALPTLADSDIDRMLDTSYGDGAFPMLSLLFPSFPFQRQFDVDHLHPRSLAGRPDRLRELGMKDDDIRFFGEHVDKLPNLELLDAGDNRIDKRAKPFAQYLEEQFPVPDRRERHLRDNDIPQGHLETADFRRFYELRRAALRERLRRELRLEPGTAFGTE
jgi:hypothetical protein